jgi:HNH endonuclease
MEEIDKIQQLLKSLEEKLADNSDEEQKALRNLDALEFPDLVAAIIDFLQPLLEPYESAIYWKLFRMSVLEGGTQYARASTRGLQSGVIVSRSGQSNDLSYNAVQTALQGLESKGAIVKAGDTTRGGTLYKVCLPEEIPVCQERMQTQTAANTTIPIDTSHDLDYYNVIENREKVFERDGYLCHYCEKQLTRFTATLDHVQPVSHGGDNSISNLVTACLHCNSRRGNRPVMEAILRGGERDA